MPVDSVPTSRTSRSIPKKPRKAAPPATARLPAKKVVRAKSSEPRARPLLVRAGARFDCFGDGLCCTDIHALGPVTRAEKLHLDLLAPGSLVRSKDLLAPVFRTQESGACVLRSARGCELHAIHGPEAKPTGCTRFPFNLVATPEGGRITTEHRCPCRTLGPRPLLTAEVAEISLRDPAGRLSTNGKVGPRVTLEPGKRVAFHRFRVIEQEIIDDLLALKDPLVALRAKPFGKLHAERWANIADKALAERDGTAYGVALAWLGNTIHVCAGTVKKLDVSERPWAVPYDLAEARGGAQTAAAVLADFLADLLWSLDWAFSVGSFSAGRRELATLYAIALQITAALVKAGVREDRAAAEAITIVELSRQSEAWEAVQQAL